jgi:hypothetical protein
MVLTAQQANKELADVTSVDQLRSLINRGLRNTDSNKHPIGYRPDARLLMRA